MSISTLQISGSALTAERTRLDVISQNIANVQTTRGPDGHAYRRRQVVFEGGDPHFGARPLLVADVQSGGLDAADRE